MIYLKKDISMNLETLNKKAHSSQCFKKLKL